METKEQSIEEIIEDNISFKGSYEAGCYYIEMEKLIKELSNLVNQACIDVLEEYNEWLDNQDLFMRGEVQKFYEKFKAEKNQFKERWGR
jgi:hypothetical protein